jgi:hypothetical protein
VFQTVKTKQLALRGSKEFENYWSNTKRRVHGGSYAKGKRKTARPIDTKKPIHLVLKSTKAIGQKSFLHPKNRKLVDETVYKYAKRFGIRIYTYSNSGNHLHLNVRAKSRQLFQSYLRTISGIIPRVILKAKKGEPKGKFWDALAFTRVADWGRAYQNLKSYIVQNILEAAGVTPYQPRKLKMKPLSG